MTDKQLDLSHYRIAQAEETLQSAKLCFENRFFKDAVNRSYYAAFYGVKAVLALENVDFKRHKDVVAYFNQYYVASGVFDKEVGKNLSRLQKKRESSDYDDFFLVSENEARDQLAFAESVLESICAYLEDWQHRKIDFSHYKG